jgi:hypothetical protein
MTLFNQNQFSGFRDLQPVLRLPVNDNDFPVILKNFLGTEERNTRFELKTTGAWLSVSSFLLKGFFIPGSSLTWSAGYRAAVVTSELHPWQFISI